jgi:hypothetical protein
MRIYGRITGETRRALVFEPAVLLERDAPTGPPVTISKRQVRPRRRFRYGLDAIEVSQWPPAVTRQRLLPGMGDLAAELATRPRRRRRGGNRPMIATAEPTESTVRQTPASHDLSTGDLARAFCVVARTVSKWIDSGMLKGYRLPGPGGHRRVRRIDAARFAREHQLPWRTPS